MYMKSTGVHIFITAFYYHLCVLWSLTWKVHSHSYSPSINASTADILRCWLPRL